MAKKKKEYPVTQYAVLTKNLISNFSYTPNVIRTFIVPVEVLSETPSYFVSRQTYVADFDPKRVNDKYSLTRQAKDIHKSYKLLETREEAVQYAKEIIDEEMGWRTNQLAKLKEILETIETEHTNSDNNEQ